MLSAARRSGLWTVSCAELGLHEPALRALLLRAHAAAPPTCATSALHRLETDAASGGVGALAWAPSGALAGFAWLRPGLAGSRFTELVELAVDPDHQGRAYGAQLHAALLPELDAGPALARCRTAATPALGLLRSRGWRVCTVTAGRATGQVLLRRG